MFGFFLSIVCKKNLVNIECPTQSGEHWQRRYDAKVWIAPRCNVLAWLLLAHKAHKAHKAYKAHKAHKAHKAKRVETAKQ